MILAKCYYVNYYVADFSAEGKLTHHEDFYQDYNNALLVAKELVKCLDVVDDVYVIDGLTGEILDTVSKAAPNENRAEDDSIPTFTDTFEDKNGGIWRLMEDGRWDYDCTDRNCSDCVYCNSDKRCGVVEPLCEKDRNYQIELANERIRVKTDKNDAISNEPFEDGFGGIWYKDEDNELWSYDCGGISCYECPYDYNIDRWDCHTSNLSLDDVKKRIAETKERIGK